MSYFHFTFFWIHMLWGIQNQLRFFYFKRFGSSSASAWCDYITSVHKSLLLLGVLLQCVNIWFGISRDEETRSWVEELCWHPGGLLRFINRGLMMMIMCYHNWYRTVTPYWAFLFFVVTCSDLPVFCSYLQWLAVTCSDLQWLAVTCSDLQWLAVTCGDLQWLAVTCSDLQWLPVTCSDLQWLPVTCSDFRLLAVTKGVRIC
jgi:hypothetical protein